jgi:dihydrofolate reductase
MGRKTVDAAKGASFDGSIKTYVFSRSRPSGEREGVTFVNESPESLVGELRKRTGKNIWMMGGGELGREFLKADLVDEIYLGIVPHCLGKGFRCFRVGSATKFFAH